MTNFKLQISIGFWALFVIWDLSFGFLARAQVAPEVILTWKANSYAPPGYAGKALPINNSPVDVALELLDGGRVANLSNIQIRWDLNGELYRSGAGLKNISFVADSSKGDPLALVSFNYRGRALDKQISIPLARPEVVITGGPDIFKALPYFFNIGSPAQAKFTWSVNGNSVEGTGENPDALNLQTDAPNGTELSIRVDAQSLLRAIEIASANISYIVSR